MRNFYTLFFLILPLVTFSQVGINTFSFSDGIELEVSGNGQQGVILTRSNIEDLTTEFPLPVGIEDGTLTFNTNTTTGIGYVWWDEPGHTWRFVDPFIGKRELYGNPVSDDDAGNLNQDISVGFKIPIFGNPEINDNNNLYTVLDPDPITGSRNLRVNAQGRYRIAVTLGLEAQDDNGDSTNDNIIEVRLQVTDSSNNISFPGAYQHSTEMEDTSGDQDDDGAVSFVEIIELNKDDVLSLVSYQSSPNGDDTVELNGTRPSSFYIIKIN